MFTKTEKTSEEVLLKDTLKELNNSYKEKKVFQNVITLKLCKGIFAPSAFCFEFTFNPASFPLFLCLDYYYFFLYVVLRIY